MERGQDATGPEDRDLDRGERTEDDRDDQRVVQRCQQIGQPPGGAGRQQRAAQPHGQQRLGGRRRRGGSDRRDQSGRSELVLDEVVDAVRGELPPVPVTDPLGHLRAGPPSVHFGHDEVQQPGQVDHLPVAAFGQEVLAAQAGAGVRPEQPDAGREPDRLVAGRPPRRRGTAVTGRGPLVSQQPHPRSCRDRGPAGRWVPSVARGGSVLDGSDPLTCQGDRLCTRAGRVDGQRDVHSRDRGDVDQSWCLASRQHLAQLVLEPYERSDIVGRHRLPLDDDDGLVRARRRQ